MRNGASLGWLLLVPLLGFTLGAAERHPCLPCHAQQVAVYEKSGMKNAIFRAGDIEKPPPGGWNFQQGAYSYNVRKDGDRMVYTVTSANQKYERVLQYAFGYGITGITWAWLENGKWVESRVSWYPSVNGIHLTVGAANTQPASIAEAAGRVMAPPDAAECFGCHSTSAVAPGNTINTAALKPGVECTVCHGPLDKHTAALKAGTGTGISNPGRGTSEEISNFCGQCHRTWDQVMLMKVKGINTIRFQPYRMTGSKCYDAEDRRISCVACHDPHAPVERNAAAYDSKCQTCHASRKSCPKSQSQCVTCHMPKLELPGAHAEFTDHRIRVVRPGQPFPD